MDSDTGTTRSNGNMTAIAQTSDEETPLLIEQPQDTGSIVKRKTPLPWRWQFSILLLLQVSAPTSQVMEPFLPQMIRDIGITHGKDSELGYYVGIVHSAFFLAEACTMFYWSRLSDKIGRKPVLLLGLLVLSVTMCGFGLSKTFWGLVASQCLKGALDGNVGVMKSMIIDVTDATNIAQAYGILPAGRSLGATLWPLIGGSLARPAERFPQVFGDSEFLKTYPYFLPCWVLATVTVFSGIITFLFLKETTKPQMSLRQYLVGCMTRVNKCGSEPETQQGGLLHDSTADAIERPSFRALLTRPVLVATGSYATSALIQMSIHTVTPVFYALPIEMGGLNLGPLAIGATLALTGIPGTIIHWIFFAPMHDWLGAKTMLLVTTALWLPVIGMFPVLNRVMQAYGPGNLFWLLVGIQTLARKFTSFTLELSTIYIGAAAPNKKLIGATNGFALTIVSLMRAVGPVTVNSALSLSIERNILGGYLVYWVMLGMAGLALWVGCLLPENMWNA